MPWDSADMKAKGARRKAIAAARMANAIREKTGDEGKAIRIALAYANRQRMARHAGTGAKQ